MKKYLDKIKKANISEYRSIPFWSWNDKLEKDELIWQIQWMKEQGFGGYFMHARGGLITEYLSQDWFDCIEACVDAGEKLNMESWAYDENGWPSGFVGGKLLEDSENHDRYLTFSYGTYDDNAFVSYLDNGEKLIRITSETDGNILNIYNNVGVSSVDILNPEVVDKFIEETHEKYKEKLGEKFGKLLKGFFTDEPQYYRYHTPYTKVINKYYFDKYGEDIMDGIGLLFVEKEGYRTFRYRYWKCMQELMLENFAKKVYDWCDNSGVQLTGHFIEENRLEYQMMCCAGIMPFYEYEHICGIDNLGRKISSSAVPKQVSSVARQLGKKRVLTETYAACGWDVTPNELRRIAEWQYVNGVNLMCQHLLPYSEHGQRKRDYPAHFSWANPWVRHDFKTFNDYFARLGYLLGESNEVVNVALFSPIRSLYFDYKRDNLGGLKELDNDYLNLSNELSAKNIPYHIVDETIMSKHACIKNGKLVVGKCAYDYIVFPKTITMDKTTETLLSEFYNQGGKFLFTNGVPEYLEGELYKYSFKNNTNWDEIYASQPYTIDNKNTDIQSTYREHDGKNFIYAVNVSDTKSYTVRLDGKFNSFYALDIETLTYKKLGKTLTFEPTQSYVLYLSNDTVEDHKNLKELVLDGEFKILQVSDNFLTLDKARYSLDGISYGDKYSCMGIFNQLLDTRYEGDLYLKYEFEVEKIPSKISFLSENMNTVCSSINGVNFDYDGVSDFEKKIYTADITRYVKIGNNEVILKIRFFEGENVYYALYGENVTESLKNCLVYNTTIEACYLQGDFGVFEKNGFIEGNTQDVLIGNEFYLSDRKDIILDTVKDGYPFFSGNMTFEKRFSVNDTNYMLNLQGRFCLCEIELNGKSVVKSYFYDKVDVSDYLIKGENVARITLYSGNRNFFGPHHYAEYEEPIFVGPYAYELTKTWKDGRSELERESYTFVRFGLFKKS